VSFVKEPSQRVGNATVAFARHGHAAQLHVVLLREARDGVPLYLPERHCLAADSMNNGFRYAARGTTGLLTVDKACMYSWFNGDIMKSSTVNISFNDDLLEQIDAVAHQESRSRSELIREAARAYIDRRNRWAKVFSLGDKVARHAKLTEQDVEREIAAYRRGK
jgi:CopG family transcriptional regulator / antitoxin EndoAI